MEAKQYIEKNRTRFYDELFSLIRIPSISAQPEHQQDMRACVEQWRKLLLSAGVDTAEIMETSSNPVVFATKIIDPSAPTVLVYAHYDVMPVEPLDLWDTNPFEPVIRDGRLWARGADDDKGQSFLQVKGFEIALKERWLHCNVKFLFEGGEEIGSPGLAEFCVEHKEMLKSDIILVSDNSMVGKNVPSITTGLRGLAYWEVEVIGPNRDLHSGIFGGAVANPINVLCKIIADITDKDGYITIPHFYDDVEEVSAAERAMLAEVPHNDKDYAESIGVKALFGEKDFSTLERTAIRPTFDVCGIWGGYTAEGSKTVLPSKATAKMSCRLVPHQQHEKISQLFIDYIYSVVPDYVTVKVTPMHGGDGYVCPIDMPAYKIAERAYEKAFGKRPLAVRRGGSIPIIADFERILGVKSLLMGFGLESNAIHSPNENQQIEIMEKGIIAVAEFYKEFGK
ncbi:MULTISPECIES: dipeptidase [Bacteroidales]|uniref:dipeptidase n=1 Tax=Bacteroidales TaxID=171549 RepID=UPI00033FEAA2|nr:dipeptidase [Gabonia massiliensis]KHM48674.1 peptidase M20 [Coprobacter secundus]CCY36464.1 putative uncharacterized protein [Tannerella sp. CAG:118]